MTTITPRTATVTIYQGDDLERLAELKDKADKLKAIQQSGHEARLGDLGDAQAAQDEYDAAVDEAAERAVVVRVNQLRRSAFRSLIAEHAPRDGNDGDKAAGFNQETFPEALLLESIVEPEMSKTSLGNFLDTIADGVFDALFVEAYWLNRSEGFDPKAAKSFATPSSDGTTN